MKPTPTTVQNYKNNISGSLKALAFAQLKYFRQPENTTPRQHLMIGLLIITHQTLGAAYTELAQHFFPNQNFSHIQILNVETTDDHTHIINQAQNIIPQLNSGNGVVILTDIFGATPCNAALKLISTHHCTIVTGLNAPMLIKAVSSAAKYNNLTEFTQLIRDAGINGIMMFTENV